jgi:hypothetical protein
MPQPTNNAARRQLDRALQGALQELRRSSGGRRQAVRMALAGVSDFIQAIAPASAPKFDKILQILIAALCDLDRGIPVPMFEPEPLGRGRRPDSFGRQQIIAYAIATTDSLIDAGLAAQNAESATAKALHDCGFVLGEGHHVSQTTVHKWREKRKQYTNSHLIYVVATNGLLNKMIVERRTANQVRDGLLENLRDVVRTWHSGPAQKTT